MSSRNKANEKSTFQKITHAVVWVMLIFTIGSIIAGVAMSAGWL